MIKLFLEANCSQEPNLANMYFDMLKMIALICVIMQDKSTKIN